MNIQVAVLCDAATDSLGKLNLLGAFDAIYTRQLPAIHPQCSVALRMNFNDAEEGTHQVHLSFVDADGRAVLQGIDLPINVIMPEDAHFATLNCIVNIQPLKFENPGLYAIDVSVDGRQKASIPLLVKYDPPKD